MEVKKILESVETLKKLTTENLSIKTSLKIHKNSEEFDSVLKVFNDKKEALLKDKDVKSLSEEEEAELMEKIMQFASEDIHVNFKKLTLEELEDIKISSAELSTIMWLIQEK